MEKKRKLMAGLCDLVKADAWLWVLAAEFIPGRQPVYAGYQYGGFNEDEFAKFLEVQTYPEMADLTAPFIQQAHDAAPRNVTRNLQDIVTVEVFESSSVYPAWNACGFHPRALSGRMLDEKAFVGTALYRRVGAPFFTPREALIIQILMTEVSWLHEQGWPEDRGAKVPDLSPRLWLVHEMLLQSSSRKQIAGHLGISENTVAGYIREIYRHFGVNSHAQLVSRFFQGDIGNGSPGI